MSTTSPNQRILNAAASDLPVKRSIRYLRVSSKRQMDTDADFDADGNSIDTQRKETTAKERAMGTVNVGEYVEPGNSAQTIDKRPVFKDMLKRIIEEGDVDYVVIYMRSRVFRNFTDAAITNRQLLRLGVKLISVKEDFGEGMMADAMEAVTDIFNELQVRQSGADIKVKMANKVRNGGTVGRAKLGYLNQTINLDGHKVNTIVTDQERQRFVPMAFELFATGEYTVETLQVALTEAGLRLPATARWPVRPVSTQTLHNLLRDRYYLGEVLCDGVWQTNGRHELLVTTELFDRVQHVLDTHSGAGTRERNHPHYLKGTIWCGRCQHRFIVQRAKGNGGEYFYFLCRGRQEGICDQPYVPVEAIEEAVEAHYGRAVVMPEAFRAEVRKAVDEALAGNVQLSDQMRTDYTKRLGVLDAKESYFLDLAAEEGWPKDKLREKIDELRTERRSIRRKLETAEQHLAVGRDVFTAALDLLNNPHELYARSDERARTILNKALFTRLYVDGRVVAGHELQEPFSVLFEAYSGSQRVEAASQTGETATSYRRVDQGQSNERGSLLTETASDRPTLIDSLALAWGKGWSKAVMVELTRLELVTFCLPDKCSTN